MSNLLFYNLYDTCVKSHKYAEQYEYAQKAYIRAIEQFFNNCIFKPHFPSDYLNEGVNPVLTFAAYEEIPPKMMYRFCEEFGFYSPTVEYLENNDSIITWRVYKFKKKVNWEQYKNVV